MRTNVPYVQFRRDWYPVSNARYPTRLFNYPASNRPTRQAQAILFFQNPFPQVNLFMIVLILLIVVLRSIDYTNNTTSYSFDSKSVSSQNPGRCMWSGVMHLSEDYNSHAAYLLHTGVHTTAVLQQWVPGTGKLLRLQLQQYPSFTALVIDSGFVPVLSLFRCLLFVLLRL